MKKILLMVAMLLSITSVTFAMSGFIDQQTINGVHCGMSTKEVIEKWGNPIGQKDSRSYYFNPGGLQGHFTSNLQCLRMIFAENNPQIVIKPSGVCIGMHESEVFRRLGNPDYKGSDFYDAHDLCLKYVYRMPDYTNFAGVKGTQDMTIWVADSDKKVVAIWMHGSFL